MYIVIRRDIASLHLSKQALEEKERQLRESEELYRRLIELSPDMILLHQNGNCLFVNKSGARMLGYEDPQELIGNSLFDYIHPDYHEIVQQRIQKMTEESAILDPIEEKIICKDGSVLNVDVAATSIQYNNQSAFMVVIRDITDKKKTEDALRKADTLSIAGSLAAGVAHEIRNPLTVLKGFIQLFNQEDHSHFPYSKIMLSEVDRIETIISDFLMLAKPQHVHFHKNCLQEIVQHTINLFETQAIMKKVQIIPNYERDLPKVECEANQLKQVFINILKNALEAMPDGGDIHVRLWRQDDNHVLIRFSDQGIGIPTEKIEKLGQPFYTTKEKGTGLGLMVSYNIIKNHKGTIQVYSEPGIGTTFDILLPILSHV
ncbi:Signal transduction histidine kinase, nitrogen sp ecific, NtrB [Aneurinibacillus migulanus]|nr:Signal transduction histidine kinase, nitrogen sp ecific, NtrB [Aneurinibacillus migulanus]